MTFIQTQDKYVHSCDIPKSFLQMSSKKFESKESVYSFSKNTNILKLLYSAIIHHIIVHLYSIYYV